MCGCWQPSSARCRPGEVQKLEPLPSRKGIQADQARQLPLAKIPPYVNTTEPND